MPFPTLPPPPPPKKKKSEEKRMDKLRRERQPNCRLGFITVGERSPNAAWVRSLGTDTMQFLSSSCGWTKTAFYRQYGDYGGLAIYEGEPCGGGEVEKWMGGGVLYMQLLYKYTLV